MTLSRYWWFAWVAAFAFIGCSSEPAGYFPKEKGAKWTYRVVTTTMRGDVTETPFHIESLGSQRLEGKDYFIRRTSSGTDYLLREDETGIYRIGERTIIDHLPRLDPQPRYVLKLPLQPGTEWRADTHPYVIRRIHPYVEYYHRSITFPMTYRIVSSNATVSVPAGIFENCIEVIGEADLTLYVDPRIGWGELPVITHEWYAKGVGLVKIERTEKLDTGVFLGGTMVWELTEFDF